MKRRLWLVALMVGASFMASACHGHAQDTSGGRREAGPAQSARFTIDTPIGQLVRDRRAKAVVDKYVPGISEGPHLAMVSPFSLRQLKPMIHGQITDDELARMSVELSAIR